MVKVARVLQMVNFGKDGQGAKELKMVKLVEKAEYGRIVYDLLSMTYVQSLAT